MKSGIIAVIAGLVIVAGILIFIFSGNQQESGASLEVPVPGSGAEEMIVNTETEHRVEMSSAGFSPSTLTINAGDTVTWVNVGSTSAWPASNNHPTHTLYPGFDAGRGISPSGSYSFKFDRVGTWGYHDHLFPSMTGTIVVQ